jgi:hypothetical protein
MSERTEGRLLQADTSCLLAKMLDAKSAEVWTLVTLLDKVFPHVDRKAVYARNKDVQTDDLIFCG